MQDGFDVHGSADQGRPPLLDFERLDVYRVALEFQALASSIALPARRREMRDQLERAALSVVLNTAEGAGRRAYDASMTYEWEARLDASVRRFKTRPRFGRITPSVLAAVPDHEVEQAIVDFVLDHGVWRDDQLVSLLTGLPSGFSIVYTTWMLDAEVSNGGFHQYFWNTSGLYVDFAREALIQLGATYHLQVFDQAVHAASVLDRPDLQGLDARTQLERFAASAMSSGLEHLDARWYELGELSAARVGFIRNNPDAFSSRLPWRARTRLALEGFVTGRRTRGCR